MGLQRGLASLLLSLAFVLIVGSVFIYYLEVYRPAQALTVQNEATGTAQGRIANNKAMTAGAVASVTSAAVATQIAQQDLYNQTTSRTPMLKDALSAQGSNKWDEGQNTDSAGNVVESCQFAGGAYHIKETQGDNLMPCLARGTPAYSNLVYQVEMTIVNGHTGGLFIRSDNNDSGYYLRISTDGTYILLKVAIAGGVYNRVPLVAGSSAVIHQGENQMNVLTIIAQGSDLYLYINQLYVTKGSDTTYTSGHIGVFAVADANSVEAVFRNVQVWQL